MKANSIILKKENNFSTEIEIYNTKYKIILKNNYNLILESNKKKVEINFIPTKKYNYYKYYNYIFYIKKEELEKNSNTIKLYYKKKELELDKINWKILNKNNKYIWYLNLPKELINYLVEMDLKNNKIDLFNIQHKVKFTYELEKKEKNNTKYYFFEIKDKKIKVYILKDKINNLYNLIVK